MKDIPRKYINTPDIADGILSLLVKVRDKRLTTKHCAGGYEIADRGERESSFVCGADAMRIANAEP